MREPKRVHRSVAVGIERQCHRSIGVEVESALSAGKAQTKRVRRESTRLSRSAFTESPEHPLELRSFGVTRLVVAAAPDLLEHPAIKRHDVVIVVQE